MWIPRRGGYCLHWPNSSEAGETRLTERGLTQGGGTACRLAS
jgi:hypothetical protein